MEHNQTKAHLEGMQASIEYLTRVIDTDFDIINNLRDEISRTQIDYGIAAAEKDALRTEIRDLRLQLRQTWGAINDEVDTQTAHRIENRYNDYIDWARDARDVLEETE
jgi:hypothetical protein